MSLATSSIDTKIDIHIDRTNSFPDGNEKNAELKRLRDIVKTANEIS